MPALFERSFNSKGSVILVRLRLTALRDAILPPFTSRTLKSVMMKAKCLKWAVRLYESKTSFRPVTIRVLKTLSGEPLYRVIGDDKGEGYIMVDEGTVLIGEITAVVKNERGAVPDLVICDERVDIDYASFLVETDSVRFKSVESLGAGSNYERIIIDIITPATITTKIMTPPIRPDSRLNRIIRGAREAYRLQLTPSYLMAQAARQWIALLTDSNPNEYTIAYAVGRLSDVLIAEVYYRLKPVTVFYGKDGRGNIRAIRGVLGRIILEPLSNHIKPVASRLLDLASYTGLGKSRSIGLGELAVTYRASSHP